MQVIGFCRFSYPAEGGFQVEHPTIEDPKTGWKNGSAISKESAYRPF